MRSEEAKAINLSLSALGKLIIIIIIIIRFKDYEAQF
jgi:hypothetical protein